MNKLIPEKKKNRVGRVELLYGPDAPFVFKKMRYRYKDYRHPALDDDDPSYADPNVSQIPVAKYVAADQEYKGMSETSPNILPFPGSDEICL
jgi:hypothetical protein